MRKLFLLTAFVPFISLAQNDVLDKKEQAIAPDAEIYNGKVHTDYLPVVSGSAYYLDDEWKSGAIMYHEVFYPSVWLKYDLFQKQVIIRHANGVSPIILFTPRIEYFNISGKKFIRVSEKDSIGLTPGIYEEIKKGKISLYIQRSKFLVETEKSLEIERKFLEKNVYYLVKDGVSINIKKQNDVWELVKNKNSAIKADLKTKGLKFKRNPELTLTEIVTYYNENNN